MQKICFPDGVWEIIRSYMPIWKYPYNQVMLELPRCIPKRYSIYTSATKQVRFKKDIYRHPFLDKQHLYGFFNAPFGGIPQNPIITYEIYTEKNQNNSIYNYYGQIQKK